MNTALCPDSQSMQRAVRGKYPPCPVEHGGASCIHEEVSMRKLVSVVVVFLVALYLLSTLAPGVLTQLRKSPLGDLFANPFQVAKSHVASLQVQAQPQGQGEYAVVGPPTVSADFINRVLAAYGSPAAGLGQDIYD